MKKSRLSIILVLALIVCMLLALPASADQQIFSSYKNIVVNNVNYSIRIMAETRTNGSCGIMTGMETSQTIGTGYFGAQPLMYVSDGSLMAAGQWDYNPRPTKSFQILSGGGLSVYPSNYYYAVSNLQLFDTTINGYRSYQSYRTANFHCPSYARMASTQEELQLEIGVNEHGMTFGSYLATEDESFEAPDLISVVATNGQMGYVLRSDFEVNDSLTLEQVQAGIDNVEVYIPVYDVDCEEIIGEFLTYKVVPKT